MPWQIVKIMGAGTEAQAARVKKERNQGNTGSDGRPGQSAHPDENKRAVSGCHLGHYGDNLQQRQKQGLFGRSQRRIRTDGLWLGAGRDHGGEIGDCVIPHGAVNNQKVSREYKG